MEFNEKRLKGLLKEQRTEYQKYLGIVSEESKSNLSLVAESVVGIQEQLVALRDMVARNTEDITSLRDMVAKNTEDIESIKIDFTYVKGGLKKKIDVDELAALERRVVLLERKK